MAALGGRQVQLPCGRVPHRGICTSAVKPCVQRLRSQTGLPRAGPASLNGRLVQGSAHTCSAAAPLRLDSPMDAARRAQIAEETGYRTVGAELPDDVTLGDVVSSLPKDVFQIRPAKAWSAVAISIVAMAASLYLISIAPWYMLPFAWAFSGTAFTGWFVVGHDCGHRSFSKNRLVEDIVGTLMFMPLIYPFEPWRIKHNVHHAHTNKLVEDTAWHPIEQKVIDTWSPLQKKVVSSVLGSPLKLWASVGHWLIWHFNLGLYTKRQRPRVLVSLASVAAFAFVALPALVATTGWFGLVKFWLVPWLGYHFWMSTFTIVHHTAPHIPFKPHEEWNAAKAQLSGTVHCDYPRWIEFLTHDINVHVPHHVSSKIPWYNLRRATDSLRENWGEFMTECHWNWRMMRNLFTEVHWYEDGVYQRFDSTEEEPFWKLQRRMWPNKYAQRENTRYSPISQAE